MNSDHEQRFLDRAITVSLEIIEHTRLKIENFDRKIDVSVRCVDKLNCTAFWALYYGDLNGSSRKSIFRSSFGLFYSNYSRLLVIQKLQTYYVHYDETYPAFPGDISRIGKPASIVSLFWLILTRRNIKAQP